MKVNFSQAVSFSKSVKAANTSTITGSLIFFTKVIPVFFAGLFGNEPARWS
jgi:hypothetical protein